MTYRMAWLAAALLCAGCRLIDNNGDGVVRVACLGDSNTFWNGWVGGPAWPTYLKQGLTAAGFPSVDVQAYSMYGSTALTTGAMQGASSLDAETYVQQAIAAHADVAIIAWGSNDVSAGTAPAVIVARLADIAAELEAAGIDALIALVPPVADPAASLYPDRPPGVVAVNELLRAAVPMEDLVEFFAIPDSDFDADAAAPIRVAPRDGTHIGTPGQQRRGGRVVSALLGTDP